MAKVKRSEGQTGKHKKMGQINLRTTPELAARADALIPWLETQPGIKATGRQVFQSTVFRAALDAGLEVLEARAAVGEAGPARRRRVGVAIRPPPEGVDPYAGGR